MRESLNWFLEGAAWDVILSPARQILTESALALLYIFKDR